MLFTTPSSAAGIDGSVAFAKVHLAIYKIVVQLGVKRASICVAVPLKVTEFRPRATEVTVKCWPSTHETIFLRSSSLTPKRLPNSSGDNQR